MIPDLAGRISSPRPRVIFADGPDPRVEEAVARLRADGTVIPLWLGDELTAKTLDASCEQAVGRFLTERPELTLDPQDPLVRGSVLVATGRADAIVAGATRTTADVLRTYMKVLGRQPDFKTVSSCMLICFPNGRTVMFGDCAVVPDPTSQQLAEIAITTAATFADLTHVEPRVALLSSSTMGSAKHPAAERVQQAVAIAQERAPELWLNGEMQFDAAFVPEVAQRKLGNASDGQNNVFIFPNLDAANIAYKIVQHAAGAQAVGPLVQGINGVAHDLSRGCTASDIVDVATVAAVQACEQLPRTANLQPEKPTA